MISEEGEGEGEEGEEGERVDDVECRSCRWERDREEKWEEKSRDMDSSSFFGGGGRWKELEEKEVWRDREKRECGTEGGSFTVAVEGASEGAEERVCVWPFCPPFAT